MSLAIMIGIYLLGLGIAIWCTKVIVSDCEAKGDDSVTITFKLIIFLVPYLLIFSILIINVMDMLGW